MTFYFRQIFVYGNLYAPRNDQELTALMILGCIALSFIAAGMAFKWYSPKAGSVLLANGFLGIFAILWSISI